MSEAAAIDRKKLLTFLRTRAETSRVVVGAVYAGLGERVDRGGFDAQESPESGGEKVGFLKERSPALTGAGNTPAGLLTPTRKGLVS